MKKIKTLIVSLILCCLLVICFSACKDPSDNGDGKDVNEYEEFTQIITTVIEKFAPKKEEGASIAKLAANDGTSVGTIKSVSADAAIDYLNSEGVKVEDDSYNNTANSMATGNLIYALSIAKALNEKCGVEKEIYDVAMKITSEEEDYCSYAVITSSKEGKTAYLYSVDGNHETLYQIHVEYNSATDFSARMIVLSMDDIVVDGSKSEAASYYFYGDTKGKMLYMMGDWRNPEHQSQVLAYRENSDGKCYSSTDLTSVNTSFSMTKQDYTTIDLQLLRSLKDKAEKSITAEQFNELINGLAEQYGLN
ncbi:MAG: hypothetical protein K2H36_00080 [Clostridia bacterium]|nr:hypothetical protein [Clostridia bacterium]